LQVSESWNPENEKRPIFVVSHPWHVQISTKYMQTLIVDECCKEGTNTDHMEDASSVVA
jgi:hypothetical protein